MSEYTDFLKPDRRLCILRLLTEVNGSANESVLHSGLEALGHVRVPREEIREDIRFLVNTGCASSEWYGQVQVVTISRRGVEAAEGRIEISGIKRPSIGL